MPELAEELVRLKVEVLVVSDSTTARAAKKSTATIPIVMVPWAILGAGLWLVSPDRAVMSRV